MLLVNIKNILKLIIKSLQKNLNMSLNYNRVAWFYDTLSRIIFGKAIIRAQTIYLPFIKPGDHILIVGGGTGWILESITKLYPKDLKITYIESSMQMIKRAKKRPIAQNQVYFNNCLMEEFSGNIRFDVVMTAFLFDNFLDEKAEDVFNAINQYLQSNALWLYSDFELNGKVWQKWLLKIMHFFFKILCRVEANKLPDTEKLFRRNNFTLKDQCNFFQGFITAKAYKSSFNNESI